MSKRFTVIAVLATTLACARHPTTVREAPAPQAHQPADDEAFKKFEAATEAYVDLRRKLEETLPKLPAEASPTAMYERGLSLERLIVASRTGAREGDVFVAEIRPVVRRICREVLGGREGRELVEAIREEAEERRLAARVNVRYPDEVPFSSIPPQLLKMLPALPAELEYRFLGSDLILLDVDPRIIVDVLRKVLPS